MPSLLEERRSLEGPHAPCHLQAQALGPLRHMEVCDPAPGHLSRPLHVCLSLTRGSSHPEPLGFVKHACRFCLLASAIAESRPWHSGPFFTLLTSQPLKLSFRCSLRKTSPDPPRLCGVMGRSSDMPSSIPPCSAILPTSWAGTVSYFCSSMICLGCHSALIRAHIRACSLLRACKGMDMINVA